MSRQDFVLESTACTRRSRFSFLHNFLAADSALEMNVESWWLNTALTESSAFDLYKSVGSTVNPRTVPADSSESEFWITYNTARYIGKVCYLTRQRDTPSTPSDTHLSLWESVGSMVHLAHYKARSSAAVFFCSTVNFGPWLSTWCTAVGRDWTPMVWTISPGTWCFCLCLHNHEKILHHFVPEALTAR